MMGIRTKSGICCRGEFEFHALSGTEAPLKKNEHLF